MLNFNIICLQERGRKFKFDTELVFDTLMQNKLRRIVSESYHADSINSSFVLKKFPNKHYSI